MILADTSIWIDHFRSTDAPLVELLETDDVGVHRWVIEELAVGSLARRDETIELLADLRSFPQLSREEMLRLVAEHRLWGRGLSAVDVHLLGAVLLVAGGRLWTRDRRLRAAAIELDVAWNG